MREKIIFVTFLALFAAITPHLFTRAEDGTFAGYEKTWKEAVRDGKLYLEAEMYEKAVDYFNGIIMEYPNMLQGYYYLGVAHYGKGDLNNAEYYLKKTIEMNPHYARAFYHLALIEHQRGNNEKVVRYLDETTLLDNTFQGAHYNKAVTLLDMGKPERAVKEFAYALYLEPEDYNSFLGVVESYKKMGKVVEEELPERGIKEISIKPAGTKPEQPPLFSAQKYASKIPRGSAQDSSVDDIVSRIAKEYVNVPPAETPEKAVQEEPAQTIKYVAAEKEILAGAMEAFISSPYERSGTLIGSGVPAEISSSKKSKKALELCFRSPADLRDKIVRLKIRGEKGDETIKCYIKSASLRRSPPFYISNLSPEWKTFEINASDKADNLDCDRIELIKLEILPPEDGGYSRVAVKDIEIN